MFKFTPNQTYERTFETKILLNCACEEAELESRVAGNEERMLLNGSFCLLLAEDVRR